MPKFFVRLLGIAFLVLVGMLLIHTISHQWDTAEEFTSTKFITFRTESQRLPIISKPNSREVTIASVICSKKGDSGPRLEAVAMIKSAIISSVLYDIDSLKFYLFLEHLEDADLISAEVEKFGEPFSQLDIELHIHSAVGAVPKAYRGHMIYHYQFRCTYVRIFIPRVLAEVDAILYLDTDVLITGSLVDIWNNFQRMTGEQLLGAVQNNEPDNPNWPDVYQEWFADIPHPPPKGLNAGILLMNLTSLRNYDFEVKILRIYDDYSRLYNMNDQRLLNIFLRFDPGLLYQMPCQFNFKNTHCDYGPYCGAVKEDPKGIQILHGAANSFGDKKSFSYVYQHYQQLEPLTPDQLEWELRTKLMTPLWYKYQSGSLHATHAGVPGNKTLSQCFGLLDKLLFKNFRKNNESY